MALVVVILFLSISVSNTLKATFCILLFCVPLIIIMETQLTRKSIDFAAYYDYSLGHYIYTKNFRTEYTFKSGDLLCENEIEHEPKKIVFKTDEYGMRNDERFNGQELVLVGDSFVVGEVTQGETIGSMIEKTYGVKTYSLANPGGINDYVRYIQGLKKRRGNACRHSRFVVFIFEGNDFPDEESEIANQRNTSSLDRWLMDVALRPGFPRFASSYLTLARSSQDKFHKIFLMSMKSILAKKKGVFSPCIVKDIHHHRIGFLTPYVKTALRQKFSFTPFTESQFGLLKGNADHIFFIPEKYRVLYKYMNNENSQELPNNQWNALIGQCEKEGIQCTNLTDALIAESDKLIEDGRFVFGKDSTHLNADGNAVVAREVYKALFKKK